MKQNVENLINYAITHKVIAARDYRYVKNQLYNLLKIEGSNEKITPAKLKYPSEALNNILDKLVLAKELEDNIVARDNFDTKIMNVFAKMPSVIQNEFDEMRKVDIKQATTSLYNYAINTNYIRQDRIDKNIFFQGNSKYGDLEITINLSKPEKDPAAIKAAAASKSTNYPLCVLCPENEGFSGNARRDARDQHRLIAFNLLDETWYLQYSPYIYYPEHLIVLKEEHEPMSINEKTFRRLLHLVKIFPHYFFGSNADLPIVGGSILNHEHYQGGRYEFPIEKAEVLYREVKDGVTFTLIDWPLATIRLRGKSIDKLVLYAKSIFNSWKNYNNNELNLKSHTEGERHHTVTPIARFKNEAYELDLILRSNITTKEHPLGLFHPESTKWHIKKENIGLIEAMGLAILPGRLLTEFAELKEYLFNGKALSKNAVKHQEWLNTFKDDVNLTNYDAVINRELVQKFASILEDCHVFKFAPNLDPFISFLKEVLNNEI
ncbi:MAG TPA: UDP-glucose--hexose-1-phosphate uridylyltransferase [Bacilli bacterium]|nr:UDP-glucose--hexose-1-phosphate uridylyltransferase [Bacilli bacterium]